MISRRARRLRRSRRRTRRIPKRQAGGGAAAAAAAAAAAVIIEPRKHRALPFVLRNFAENLPADWSIFVLHGTENEAWLKDLLAGELAPVAERIRLRSLGLPKLTVAEYNAMLKTPEFYERHVPAETFLLFQVDSMICSPDKGLLSKFLDYDYVGAPWDVGGVGNGGFSLRKKSAILTKLRACPAKKEEAEDGYFSVDCSGAKLKRPSHEEAREFSVETVYSPRSFGVHKPWLHLSQENKKALEARCPGLEELRRLQHSHSHSKRGD